MAKRYQASRMIAAPAERVWALLTDARGYHDWNPSIISLDGQITPGATLPLPLPSRELMRCQGPDVLTNAPALVPLIVCRGRR